MTIGWAIVVGGRLLALYWVLPIVADCFIRILHAAVSSSMDLSAAVYTYELVEALLIWVGVILASSFLGALIGGITVKFGIPFTKAEGKIYFDYWIKFD